MSHQFRDTFPSDKPITRNHVVRALWRVAVEWSKGFSPFSEGQMAKLSRWGKHLECIDPGVALPMVLSNLNIQRWV